MPPLLRPELRLTSECDYKNLKFTKNCLPVCLYQQTCRRSAGKSEWVSANKWVSCEWVSEWASWMEERADGKESHVLCVWFKTSGNRLRCGIRVTCESVGGPCVHRPSLAFGLMCFFFVRRHNFFFLFFLFFASFLAARFTSYTRCCIADGCYISEKL